MKAIGVIPARWGSTRLPGKSLVMLCGKPLVLRVYERAIQAKRLEAVLVATDDERIRAVIEAAGGRVAMTRADHPSGTDRVEEAVRGLDAEIVVNVQGDEPLIEPGLIDGLVDALEADARFDMATAAAPISGERERVAASVVKVVWRADGEALYFSRSPIPHVRDALPAGAAPLHWRHLGIYAYRAAFLRRFVAAPPSPLELAEKLEQLRALHIGGRIRILTTHRASPGVDTPEDVAITEQAIRDAGLA